MEMLPRPIARRQLLAGALAVSAAPSALLAASDPFAGSPWRKLSDADWKRRLPPPSYDVLRHGGTETPWTSPLVKEHRAGTFVCLGWGLPLVQYEWSFEYRTGGPSLCTALPRRRGKQAHFIL